MPPVGAMPRVGATAPAAGEGSRLHRKLSSFGVLLLTLSCLSPVFSIYGVGSDVLLHAGTGAAAAFICGIGVAIVWAVVYAELGSAYPYAGGDYVGVGSILGAWAGFASLTAWAVTLAPTIAFLAKTITVYVGDLVPAASPSIVTFGALAAALAVALLAVRTSAFVTGIFLAIEMLAVLVLIGVGLWHPARGLVDVVLHPVTLSAAETMGPVPLAAMALAGVSAAFATCGGNQAIAFGDLFLADIRAYRERKLSGTGLEPLFPLWHIPTPRLAREMIAGGLRARLTCVDPVLPREFAGREFDLELIEDLPSGVDPCGENGEFHTFVTDGPGFARPLNVTIGTTVERDGFVFTDVTPASPGPGGNAPASRIPAGQGDPSAGEMPAGRV